VSATDAGAVGRPRTRLARPFERRAAEAACVGVMVIWGANFVVVKSTMPVLTPLGYALLRFSIGGAILLGLCRWREGSVRIPRADIPAMAALGLLGFGIYQLLWSTALSSTSVGNSALLIASTPLFTALIAAALGADTLSRSRVAGIAIAFVGVAIVVAAGEGLRIDSAAVGDLMTIGAAISWAVYVSLGAGILRRYSPLRATAWTVSFGALFLTPFGLAQLSTVDPAHIGAAQVGAVAYSALLSCALGNLVVFWGISLLGPTRVTNLQFLPPVIALVFAAIFLGDPILVSQVVGGLVILGGILVARRDRSPGRGRALSAGATEATSAS